MGIPAAAGRIARAAALAGLLLAGLLPALVGCASSRPAAGRTALAADYLAIARPANHRLDVAVSSFDHSKHTSLTVAQAALRAEAATEHRFDRQLLAIPFPPPIAATARALVRANERRIALTELQARAASLADLAGFTAGHIAADAAVEEQVRIIRSELGLPPPESS